jgi:stage V sporulation protein G
VEVTEVRIAPIAKPVGLLVGYASITLDNEFLVRDIRVLHGQKGFFIAMPSRRRHDGSYSDVAHPMTPELRKKIEDAILNALDDFFNMD